MTEWTVKAIEWWLCPFSRWRSYRVRKTFDTDAEHFGKGEVLRFRYHAFSHYDGATGYFFSDPGGNIRRFDVYGSRSKAELAAMAAERFEALPLWRGRAD